jgi:hypothetical protein
VSEYEFVAWLLLCVAALSFGAGFCLCKITVYVGWLKQPAYQVSVTLDDSMILNYLHAQGYEVKPRARHVN